MKFSPYAWKSADLVGGDPSVDFVNTASSWKDGPVDRLGGFEAYADWAALAGLIERETAASLKEKAGRDPEGAEAAFVEAQGLRATLWRLFTAAAHDRRADSADLAALKDWTRRAASFLELHQTEQGFEDRWATATPPLAAPAFKLALSAEALLKSGRLDRLHACNGAHCEWMFLDVSKNASRRWCSMSTCGNDAKVKKFRGRRTAKAAAN